MITIVPGRPPLYSTVNLDTPKEDKPPNKGQTKSTLYKITSKRGQTLHKGQNAGVFKDSTVLSL